MHAPLLLDLLASDDLPHREQGMELLRAAPPRLRQDTLEHAVHTRRWTEALLLLADGDPHEQARLHSALHARLLLRLVDVRAGLGEPLPPMLSALLHQLIDAPLAEQALHWHDLCALVRQLQPVPPAAPPSLYSLLAAGLRSDLEASAMQDRLRTRRRWFLLQDGGTRWFTPQRPLLHQIPGYLAETRATEAAWEDWPLRWAALTEAPSPEHIAAVESALEHAAWHALQRYLPEEQQALDILVLDQGARSEHLFIDTPA